MYLNSKKIALQVKFSSIKENLDLQLIKNLSKKKIKNDIYRQ